MIVEFQATPLGPLPSLDISSLATSRTVAIDPGIRPAFVAHGDATANIERLFDGAFCVTTGQQPGLFTGPLYTLYKALSVIAVARVLETNGTQPVVPVFWVAGDDHDFDEANHIHLLTVENTVQRLVLRERPSSSPLVPLYKERLGPEISDVIDALAEATPDTEFSTQTLDWLTSHYRPERDFASAFADALAELLGPYGLVVFCPTHTAAKAAMAPYLVSALEHAAALDRSLKERAQMLEEEGRSVPVSVGDQATTVMIEGKLGRDRLVLNGDRYTARRSGETWTLAELKEVGERKPERLSPNVLLRPVVEAALLPTLAYVGGPSELDYFLQCMPIYAQLGVAPQAVVPRWSGRLIEARVAKVLDKYGIAADDLAGSEGPLEASLVADAMPPEAKDALATLLKTVEAEYERLEGAAAEVDPTLRRSVRSARNQALAGLSAIDRRLVAHLKKQNAVVVQQLAKVRSNLFPLGRPQERIHNVAPFLIRYGPELLDAGLQAAESWIGRLES